MSQKETDTKTKLQADVEVPKELQELFNEYKKKQEELASQFNKKLNAVDSTWKIKDYSQIKQQ